MIINLKLTKGEKITAKEYAKHKGIPLKTLIKTIFFESIENEYCCSIVDNALKEFEKNPKTYTHEEVKKKLGI